MSYPNKKLKKNDKQDEKTCYIKNDFYKYRYNLNSNIESNNSAIVIDCGSFRIKAGWSDEPVPQMVFPPITTEMDESNKAYSTGNDIMNCVPLSSDALRCPFSKSVVCDFNYMEKIFDYLFFNLLRKNSAIESPILLTEPLYNPSLSRFAMTEMLFENYRAPSICYAVDFLLSYFYNTFTADKVAEENLNVDKYLTERHDRKNDIILSVGHETTSVAPLLHGFCDFENSYQIPVGGKTPILFLGELLKQKYTELSSVISEEFLYEVLTKHCFVSKNFLKDINDRDSSKNGNSLKIKFDENPVKDSYFSRFLKGCKNGKYPQIVRYKDYEVATKVLQFFISTLEGKDNDVISFSDFLTLLSKFNFENEDDFVKSIEQVKKLVEPLSNKGIVDFNIEKSSYKTVRVKTRESLRKQKEAKIKNNILLSQIDEKSDIVSEYWNGCELINSKLDNYEDYVKALNELFTYDLANFCIELNNEQFRVPELYFQPSLVGYFEIGGIGDTLSHVMKARDLKEFSVFIDGGATQISGFDRRVLIEASTCRKSSMDKTANDIGCRKSNDGVDKSICLNSATDKVYDAWNGGSLFASSEYFKKHLISLDEYNEKGLENLFSGKEHFFSNKYTDLSPEMLCEYEF